MTAFSALLLLLLISSLSDTVLAAKLKMVVVYHRHGARNTLHNYGTTPQILGELNPVGIKQMMELGQLFRKKYIDEAKLLPSDCDADLIYVRATAINRTQASAKAFLSGLYPDQYPIESIDSVQINFSSPNLRSTFNQSLPITINVVPSAKDYLLHPYEKLVCPHMNSFQDAALTHENYTTISHAFNSTFQKILQAMNLSHHQPDLHYMSGVSDYLYSNYQAKVHTEVEVGTELWNDFMLSKNITVMYLKYSTRNEMNVYTTKMYEELLARMDSLIAGKSPIRLVEYSAHDYTVNLILASMNITSWQCLFDKYQAKNYTFDHKCPFTTEVGGSVTLELYQQDHGTYTVKLLYGNDVYPVNGKLEIPYNEFASLLRSSMVPNFSEQCLGETRPVIASEPSPYRQRLLGLLVLGVTILLLAFAFFLRRRSLLKLSMGNVLSPVSADDNVENTDHIEIETSENKNL